DRVHALHVRPVVVALVDAHEARSQGDRRALVGDDVVDEHDVVALGDDRLVVLGIDEQAVLRRLRDAHLVDVDADVADREGRDLLARVRHGVRPVGQLAARTGVARRLVVDLLSVLDRGRLLGRRRLLRRRRLGRAPTHGDRARGEAERERGGGGQAGSGTGGTHEYSGCFGEGCRTDHTQTRAPRTMGRGAHETAGRGTFACCARVRARGPFPYASPHPLPGHARAHRTGPPRGATPGAEPVSALRGERADVVVVGGGAARLRAAVAAEGGAAGVVGDDDSLEQHVADTVAGGAGLCEEDAVRFVVERAAGELYRLERWGLPWSRTDDGDVAVRRFGGMSRARTWFAADKTGFHLLHTLFQTSLRYSGPDGPVRRYDEHHVL